MSSTFSKIVPKTPLEQERFYLDSIEKLGDTASTLADEEKKSPVTTNGRITELNRIVDGLIRDTRTNRQLIEQLNRQSQEIRILRSIQPATVETIHLRAHIAQLEARIRDIEGQL